MKNKPYLVDKHVFLARMSVGDSTETLPPMFKGVGGCLMVEFNLSLTINNPTLILMDVCNFNSSSCIEYS